jgi:hypothetical protein
LVTVSVVVTVPDGAVTSTPKVKVPAKPFARKAGAVAMPEESVVTRATVLPSGQVPLGPADGALNVTITPATGIPEAVLTVTWNGVGKTVPAGVDCPPPVAEVTRGTPLRMFVVSDAETTSVTPPPVTVATFTSGEEAFNATLTVAVIGGKLCPARRLSVRAQPEPEQTHPVPDMELKVIPAGTFSRTVTAEPAVVAVPPVLLMVSV